RGMSGKMVGVPARKEAIRERGAEIAEHRVEMVLRVPGNDLPTQRPGERSGQPHGRNGGRSNAVRPEAWARDTARSLARDEGRGIGHRFGSSRILSLTPDCAEAPTAPIPAPTSRLP